MDTHEGLEESDCKSTHWGILKITRCLESSARCHSEGIFVEGCDTLGLKLTPQLPQNPSIPPEKSFESQDYGDEYGVNME